MAAENPNDTQQVDVLIAEDSRIQAELLRRRLVEEGYLARVAENGAEALRQIQQRKPTIVVSDIEMPEMDGYALCKAIKSDPQLRRIPVVLLSSLADPTDIIRGLDAGADNYVTKPYEPDYLLARIAALLTTPIADDAATDRKGLEVTLAGKRYVVDPGRHQVLNLLVSTFENAVTKNNELIRVNEKLTVTQDQLQQQNRQLAQFNTQIEQANDQLTSDLQAAADVQQSLLPTALPDVPGFGFAWCFRPCDELAGDFLNVVPLDDRHVALYVVDVSGHGVASSLLSVSVSRMLMTGISSVLVKTDEATGDAVIAAPDEVLVELNERFPMELAANKYFTIVYGILDLQTRQFRYASAGQPPIAHLDASGQANLLTSAGLAIGWLPDAEYELETLTLNPGDRLWLYSDGVPEAMNEQDEQYGDERMLAVMQTGHGDALEDAVAQLVSEVEGWCGDSDPMDDVSVLALEVVSVESRPDSAASD